MVVLRISWIVLLVIVILLTNSPVESASAARKRKNLSSRDNVLRMVARNAPIPFTGSSAIAARDNQPAPRALRKRKLANGKRYNNQFPKYHKRSKKFETSEI
ncbi:13652_t:CDS:2 [Funneliformis geosporum]|uniref:10929_t:CDS:1 n=1 Tax=Funneliformis geosporum TaxID=1117311 RepID=A0A9W4WR80_9GLOM|nr:13652_t:CDS:2 [Funneliformis geosporum]CAI2180632.1 10929_t:CDS:2 [Funneliformis geosporum]